jgi:hypothetical protein
MLCTLYHDVKRTTSMLLLCDHSFYLTHAFYVSCLLVAPRNLSNDFPQVHTVYYSFFLSITDYKVLFPLDASLLRLRLDLQNGPFPSGFTTKMFYIHIYLTMRATLRSSNPCS